MLSTYQSSDIHRAVRAFSFDASVYDRSRVRRALGLNLSLSLAASSSVPRSNRARYAQLFSTAYAVFQTDLGLSEGTTLKDVGAAGPVLNFSGTRTGDPVPIWVKATSSGALGAWNYAVYYDGLGTTPAMTGTSAATIPLTGSGNGLTVNVAAGNATSGNIWKATAGQWNDQTANAKHAVPSAASRQPVIGIGVNGKVELLFDGIDDYMLTTVGSLIPAPASTPSMILVVGRLSAHSAGNNCFTSGDSFAGTIYESSLNTITLYNSLPGPSVALSALTLQRFAATYTGSVGDILKVGGSSATTANGGNAVGTNRSIGGTTVPGQFLNGGVFAVIWLPVAPYAAFDALINTDQGYGAGAVAT